MSQRQSNVEERIPVGAESDNIGPSSAGAAANGRLPLLVSRRALPNWATHFAARLYNLGARHRRWLFWLPATYAAVGGFGHLIDQRFAPLDPDVITYLEIAKHWTLRSFWGGFREPVWPALLAVPVQILGPDAITPRVFGVLGFILLVAAFQVLVRRLYGSGWGLMAGMVLAASPWLIFNSARGLREETSAALVVLFAIGMLRKPWSTGPAVAMCALAGVAGMLRWDTVIIMLPTLLVAYVVRRPPAIAWLAGPIAFAIIVFPLLAGNYAQSGDPFYHSNIHARFFRNQEFKGQPGFPTVAEVQQNGFAGPPITWTQYLFGLHTPRQLAFRAIRGAEDIPLINGTLLWFYPESPQPPDGWPTFRIFAETQFIAAWAMLLLAIVGFLSLLRTAAWPVALMLPLSMGVYMFIASLIDYRLVIPVLPLTLVADMEAIAILWPRLFGRIGLSLDRLLEASKRIG
jgi:hypothetical protein